MSPTSTEPVLSAGVIAGLASAIATFATDPNPASERALITAAITFVVPILLACVARQFAWSPASMSRVVGQLRAAIPHPMEIEQATGNGRPPAGVTAPDLGVTNPVVAPPADPPATVLH